jgi:hypothetical protein
MSAFNWIILSLTFILQFSKMNLEACYHLCIILRCDQLKNQSSRRVTYGNPCYSIGSKANSIYFLNDRSVFWMLNAIPYLVLLYFTVEVR